MYGAGIPQSIWQQTTCRMAGVQFPAGQEIFLYSIVSAPALGPTQLPTKWVPGALSPWDRVARAWSWPPPSTSSTEFKKDGAISPLPICLHANEDNFTFIAYVRRFHSGDILYFALEVLCIYVRVCSSEGLCYILFNWSHVNSDRTQILFIKFKFFLICYNLTLLWTGIWMMNEQCSVYLKLLIRVHFIHMAHTYLVGAKSFD